MRLRYDFEHNENSAVVMQQIKRNEEINAQLTPL